MGCVWQEQDRRRMWNWLWYKMRMSNQSRYYASTLWITFSPLLNPLVFLERETHTSEILNIIDTSLLNNNSGTCNNDDFLMIPRRKKSDICNPYTFPMSARTWLLFYCSLCDICAVMTNQIIITPSNLNVLCVCV